MASNIFFRCFKIEIEFKRLFFIYLYYKNKIINYLILCFGTKLCLL